jgi:peptidoglycan hydrolase CwlO-like protein
MERKSQIYVKVDDYKDIVDIVTLLKKKITDARGILNSINNLKNEEDSEIDQWNSNLDEINTKIDFINRSLFE